MDKNKLLQGFRKNAVYLVKWMVISCVMGTGCGLIGAAFGRLLKLAGSLSESFGFLLYLMPAAGLAVVLIHELFHQVGNKGTNLVLESVSADERIRPSVLPCIFLSAVLTILWEARREKWGHPSRWEGVLVLLWEKFFTWTRKTGK